MVSHRYQAVDLFSGALFSMCVLAAQSCLTSWIPWIVAHQVSLCMESSRQYTGVDCHALLQGIFLTQGLNLVSRIAGRFFAAEPPGKPCQSLSSVAQSSPTLCDPMDCRTSGMPVTNSRSLLKLMSIESVMPSKLLIVCHPLLLLPSIFPWVRVFSNESALRIRWPKYRSFSFSIRPPNEYSGLISFRMDWLDLPVQGTLKSSPTPQFKRINYLVLSFLYSPTLKSIRDYWKNHSLD